MPGTMFTDGSKLQSPIGVDVYSPNLELKILYRLADHCIVYQAEVQSINEGIDFLLNIKLNRKRIFIF